MSRSGWSRLYRWGRRWWLRMQQRALIVAYHRIAEPTLDPQLLCVSPQHFAEHLEIMTRAYAPLSLRALGQRVEEGRVPSRALVVTFDDGYADNLSHATPLLERYGVPATVFVVSGAVGPPREFWWDTLARLVLQPSSLPHHLRITVAGQVHMWDLGSAATWTEEQCQRYREWNVTCPETPTPRHAVYRRLHQLLYPLDDRTQSQVLHDITQAAQWLDEGHGAPRGLTPEEVRRLSESDVVDIGAHTTTHASLAHHTVAEQRCEIQENRRVLEAMIDRPVCSFAYPFGTYGDVNTTTVALVREAGFHQACTVLPGVVTSHSDRWQLPRCIIRNWDGEEFARRLRTMFAP
jgi:peptidoglycan/xylan/chitin deacetylase (PgdA/CDA1 family)